MAEWRIIADFPDYAVSDDGGVKRIRADKRNHRFGLLRPWKNNKGYLIVTLCRADGIRKKCSIHRLVCAAFHGPPPTPLHHAAHGDGVPANNAASNLRWATRSENMEDARRHGTMAMGASHGRTLSPEKTPRGEQHGHAKLTEADVRAIRSSARFNGSGRILAAQFGVSPAAICIIRSGKTWKHVA